MSATNWDRTGTNSNLYVNGVLENSTPVASISYVDVQDIKIGIAWQNSYRPFNGTIDEVRIWNRALAPDETVTMKQII